MFLKSKPSLDHLMIQRIALSYQAASLAEFLEAIDALAARGLPCAPQAFPAAAAPQAFPPAAGKEKHPVEAAYNADSFAADGARYRAGKKFTITGADCQAVGWKGERAEIPADLRLAAIVRRLVSEGMPAEEVQELIADAPQGAPEESAAPEVSPDEVDPDDL
jgi:hypothetical protein